MFDDDTIKEMQDNAIAKFKAKASEHTSKKRALAEKETREERRTRREREKKRWEKRHSK